MAITLAPSENDVSATILRYGKHAQFSHPHRTTPATEIKTNHLVLFPMCQGMMRVILGDAWGDDQRPAEASRPINIQYGRAKSQNAIALLKRD
jgi:hypothetical protein